MSCHTPAPWHPVKFTYWWELKNGPSYTATNILQYHDGRCPEHEAEANARLAAAAPELLEACEEALSGFNFIADNCTRHMPRGEAQEVTKQFALSCMARLDWAIRKATKARGKKAGRR